MVTILALFQSHAVRSKQVDSFIYIKDIKGVTQI